MKLLTIAEQRKVGSGNYGNGNIKFEASKAVELLHRDKLDENVSIFLLQ